MKNARHILAEHIDTSLVSCEMAYMVIPRHPYLTLPTGCFEHAGCAITCRGKDGNSSELRNAFQWAIKCFSALGIPG